MTRKLAIIMALGTAVLAAAAADSAEKVIGTWVTAGGPYGIYKKSYGRDFPVDVIVSNMVEIGVNEVGFFDQGGRGGPFSHPTKVQYAKTEGLMGDQDWLKDLLEETQKHNIKVWLAWTPPGGKYPGTDISGLNDPRMLKLYCDEVEEIGRNYGHYKNLAGIFWHEVDCSETEDNHADDGAEFSSFCEKRFGEKYTGATMPEVNSQDKWFRRFMLYRNQVVNNLVETTAKAARRFGLQMTFCYYPAEPHNGESWRWGYDVVDLEALCAHQWFVGYGEEFGKAYQSITGAWIDFGPSYSGQILPRNYSYAFHGRTLYFFEFRSPIFMEEMRKYYGGIKDFTQKYGDFYIGYVGYSEKELSLFFGKQNLKNWMDLMSAWQGGDSPAKVAVAINPTPFVMKYPLAPGVEYAKKVRGLMMALTEEMDVDAFVLGSRFALDPDNLLRYSLIIVPQDMGEGLTKAMAKSLRKYVAKGGKVLAMATPLIQSRADLTEGRELTAELFGVEDVKPKMPAYVRPEGGPVQTNSMKQWADGMVEVRVKDAEVVVKDGLTGAPLLLRKGNGWFSTMSFSPESARLIRQVVREAAVPPATLEDNNGLRILESVRKEGAICFALWGTGQAKLAVDAPALGLKDKHLQVKDIVTGAVLAETDAKGLAQGVVVKTLYTNQPLVVAIGPAAKLASYKGIYPSVDVFQGMDKVTATENPEVPIMVPEKPGVKVGVYHGGTAAGTLVNTLVKEPGVNCFMLPRLDNEALAKSQVIIIPQAGSALFFNRSREMVRDWVAKGGRIMLLYDSVGYKGRTPYFPEIGEGVTNPKTHEAVVVKEHPVTAGFKTGQKLKHAYTDHVGMKPGPQGEMLLKDERDLAVVVAGKVGKGKVVLNGMITGYASLAPGDYNGKEAAPEGDELRIFLNAVKWLAEDEGARQPRR